ncbi:MAG: MFS transporter, partial [Devosia sp.]
MRALLPAILVLGVTQIIGYGTCYYAYAILAPAVGLEFAVPAELLFGIFSGALLAGGLASPYLGKLMDRIGAARLMAIGSLAAAALLFGLAASPNIYVFGTLIVLLEIVGVMILYNAAFATLAQLGGSKTRRAITYLTLIAGFASTLFWPLTGWLLEEIGWRMSYLVFALLHLGIALPLHLWLAHHASGRHATATPSSAGVPVPETAALSGKAGRIAFIAVALSFALSNLVAASFAVHLVSTLQMVGLGATAYLL